ncbi:MAG: carboxypeptidase regulatory-like domain-containing protein, partial [Candidatus Hodarchaeota archaeon]
MRKNYSLFFMLGIMLLSMCAITATLAVAEPSSSTTVDSSTEGVLFTQQVEVKPTTTTEPQVVQVYNEEEDTFEDIVVPQETKSAGTGYIEVTVRDSVTSALLQSASVRTYNANGAQVGTTQYTNSRGFANMTGLDIGWITVKVAKAGYVTQEKQDYINWEGDDDYLSFYLVPFAANDGFIEVTVRNQETSAPILSAAVQTFFANGTQIGSTQYTNAGGWANMTGLYAVAWYEVRVTKVGFITQSKQDLINWNGDDDYLYFYMVPYAANDGFIEVTVLNQANSATLPSAKVETYFLNGTKIGTSKYTDITGFANMTGLYVGWYEVRVSKTGFFTQSKQNYINWNGDDDYLTFYLEPYAADSGFIEVYVRNSGGTPLSNAYVKVQNMTTAIITSGYTDASGFFNATGLRIGWHNVTVSKVGYVPQTKDDYI